MTHVETSGRAELPVYLVDDDEGLLKATQRTLASAGILCRTFDTGESFLSAVDPYAPGVALLDLVLPGISGLQVQAVLAAREALVAVVLVSGQANIPLAVESMKIGAVDVLVKPCEERQLLAGVAAGRKAAHTMASLAQRRRRAHELIARLTPREREVLDHVVLGRLNKQTAATLGTSEKTIKIHRGRVMHKLEADSVVDLCGIVADAGLTYDQILGSIARHHPVSAPPG